MLHGPDYWKHVLIIVPIVATAFATLCFTLRIYSRLKVLRGLRVEDILMGVGLICTYGVAACIVYCEFAISLAMTPSSKIITSVQRASLTLAQGGIFGNFQWNNGVRSLW